MLSRKLTGLDELADGGSCDPQLACDVGGVDPGDALATPPGPNRSASPRDFPTAALASCPGSPVPERRSMKINHAMSPMTSKPTMMKTAMRADLPSPRAYAPYPQAPALR